MNLLSVEWLVVYSLATAFLTNGVLVWLLCRIHSTFALKTETGVGGTELGQTAGSGASRPYWPVGRPTWGGCAIALSLWALLMLFTITIDHYNEITVHPGAIAACALIGLLLAYVVECKLLPRLRPFQVSMLSLLPIKEGVAITGTLFALFAGKIAALSLTKSSNSNMAAVYGQNYQNDAAVAAREWTMPGLWRLYLQENLVREERSEPGRIEVIRRELVERDFQKPTVLAQHYWQNRLEDYLKGYAVNPTLRQVPATQLTDEVRQVIGRIDSVEALLRFSEGDESISPSFLGSYVSQGASHVTVILNNLHQIHDYAARGVIPDGDTETWLGYFEDMGPHPIVLAGLWNWLERDYMTEEFFLVAEGRLSGKKELRDLLKQYQHSKTAGRLATTLKANSPGNRNTVGRHRVAQVPEEFYPEMAHFITTHVPEKKERRRYTVALANLAVFNTYIVAQPNYDRLVGQLSGDRVDAPEDPEE